MRNSKYKLMAHQKDFSDQWLNTPRILNFSGCGTGKTLSVIHTIKAHLPDARVLVLAPLSILRPAWGGDLDKFWPEAEYAIAYAKDREKKFTERAQFTITNHDAIKIIVANNWHLDFDVLVVDEADAFRNRTTQRTKALLSAAHAFDMLTLMTGTPTPKSVTDVWSLAYAIDKGERLGKNFFGFRSQVQNASPIYGCPNPKAMKWEDNEDAVEQTTMMLCDVTHRVELDDVVELPETITRTYPIQMPPKLQRLYDEFNKESMMMLDSGQLIDAIHAGARRQKLLQLCSGAVYDGQGGSVDIHPDRQKLVLDLVEEAKQSLVAFNWHHQVDGLIKEAKARKLTYGVINSKTSVPNREKLVAQFQQGKLQVLFCHPQSAGHGLTLTQANRVIWASPTDRADLFEQFNHRMRRKGITHKSEIILIAAEGTSEEVAYDNMMVKKHRQDDLLTVFAKLSKAA
jgi:SNF2 family DNA or RNA helicase